MLDSPNLDQISIPIVGIGNAGGAGKDNGYSSRSHALMERTGSF